MLIGNKEFTNDHAAIMAILNVTPDSFSDGGTLNSLDDALFRVRRYIEEGAEIIDVGGESTRPGFAAVRLQEEIERVVPVIEAIKREYNIPVSVDTYKAGTAEAAILAGADLVNDVWGLKKDPQMKQIIAKYQKPCCLMHNRTDTCYTDFMTDCMKDLEEVLSLAHEAGIAKDRIILDPGVGFAKSLEQNLKVMANLEAFKRLGCQLLLGTSRKSMIGLTLDLPVDQRVEGTVATSVMAVMAGYAYVRVHDVKENYRAIKMTEAILRAR